MSKELIQKGKFMAFVLRHGEKDLNIVFDKEGWLTIAELLAIASREGQNLSHADIVAVVETNDKKRYQLSEDGLSVRALQGHSNPSIDRTFNTCQPLDKLYHGTTVRFVDSIMAQGLTKQSRQHVHLSGDIVTATKVGQRHGKLAMLEIDSLQMFKDGFQFSLSENNVWLVEHVPSKYIRVV